MRVWSPRTPCGHLFEVSGATPWCQEGSKNGKTAHNSGLLRQLPEEYHHGPHKILVLFSCYPIRCYFPRFVKQLKKAQIRPVFRRDHAEFHRQIDHGPGTEGGAAG